MLSSLLDIMHFNSIDFNVFKKQARSCHDCEEIVQSEIGCGEGFVKSDTKVKGGLLRTITVLKRKWFDVSRKLMCFASMNLGVMVRS